LDVETVQHLVHLGEVPDDSPLGKGWTFSSVGVAMICSSRARPGDW
jgi:hypothetical protein